MDPTELRIRAVSSGVEHDIHTVGVGGSKPSPPTKCRRAPSESMVPFSFWVERPLFAAEPVCLHGRVAAQALSGGAGLALGRTGDRLACEARSQPTEIDPASP